MSLAEITSSRNFKTEKGKTMRRAQAVVIATAVVVISGGVFGISAASGSTSTPPTDSQLVRPAVSNASGQFFTSDQLQTVWTAVTDRYPRALPAGDAFPAKPTTFFDPDTSATTVLYQAGLVDEIVANYWECSWLQAGLKAEQAGQVDDLKKADQAVSSYGSLPSVSSALDVGSYRAAVAAYAKEAGIADLRQAEFELECSK